MSIIDRRNQPADQQATGGSPRAQVMSRIRRGVH